MIIAQERMANNIVLVFHRKPPSRYSWVAEIRSQAENSNKPPQQFTVALKSKIRGGTNAATSASSIVATIPHIREPIPVAILLRALGCLSDKQIINKICYDPEDQPMVESLRPSLEEAMGIMTEDEALDFIAKRGAAAQYTRDRRIAYAIMILESEFLPHISTTQEGTFKKTYFVGYMVNRLIQASLGRTPEDDRDYYGKKRMDMAGSLLSGLFRQLFRQVVEDMLKYLKREIDLGRDTLNLVSAIKSDVITRGLRSALATGNWGKDKQGDVQKTGVA